MQFRHPKQKKRKSASMVPLPAATEENKHKGQGGYVVIEHDKDRGKKDILIMCVLRQLKSMDLEELRRVYTMTCGICDGKKKNIEQETANLILPTK